MVEQKDNSISGPNFLGTLLRATGHALLSAFVFFALAKLVSAQSEKSPGPRSVLTPQSSGGDRSARSVAIDDSNWHNESIAGRFGQSETVHDNQVDCDALGANNLNGAPELRGGWPFAWFRHAGRGDPGRHIGLGQPLEGTSWLNRPYHIDFFVGGLFADELIAGDVDQRDGFFGGLRAGCDFDHYWGAEVRFSDPTMDLVDSTGSSGERGVYNYSFDINLLYYPWGDARWRPYASLGMGMAGFRFVDHTGIQIDQALLQIPLGAGLKYQASNNMAVRFDLVNNLAVGSAELETMTNVSLTAGVEFHFGAGRPGYYPWNGSSHLW